MLASFGVQTRADSVDDEVLAAGKNELTKFGVEPTKLLTQLMTNNRVVAVGEVHSPASEEREHGREIIEALKAGGATHLAVEMPLNVQPVLNQFMATGQLDRSKLPEKLRSQSYVDVLIAAKENGMQIVAVDGDQAQPINQKRDQTMDSTIRTILSDAKNKVVFWVGADHLEVDAKDMCDLKGTCIENAVQLLRKSFTVPTVFSPVDPHDNLTYLGQLQHWIKRSAAVATQQAGAIGAMTAGTGPMREWDYIIFYPPAGPMDKVPPVG